MPFSSLLFLHAFLPLFLAAYWCSPTRFRNGVAIAASLLFYAWGAPRFLPVVVALGVIDFAVSHAIGRARARADGQRRARLLLGLGITGHLSILAYFKYSNFFVGQANELFALLGVGAVPWTHVVLPIGISFITFEEISYLVDVYRGDARPARRLSHYVLFLTLFPHSIAGPIFRWKDLEAQLASRTESWTKVRTGFERFAIGLAKKVLVADSVAVIADGVFALPADQLTPQLAWLGAVAYTIQIYFDFSGYSDMAIGLGKMIGFDFKENFNRPYIAASLTEFWQRWHISLSSWLRDYLYIPLGGNRRGPRRAIVNLVIVFGLSGLWHGAAWTFVVWGLFHGTFVAVERVLGPRRDRVPLVLQHVTTLGLVIVGWVFFRATSFDHATNVLAAMFGSAGDAPLRTYPGDLAPRSAQLALALGIVICLAPVSWKYAVPFGPVGVARIARAAAVLRAGFCVLVLVMSAMHLTNMKTTPLIYFKF